MSRKSTLFTAALIILFAATLRLVALPDIPPGLHFDEAANGIIAARIAFTDYKPLFITSFTGKETLWFYFAALVMRLAGQGIFPLRLASVLIGTLTVAATGWLVRRLYPDDPRRDQLALLSMAVLAVAFWHGVLSRLAFRAISQPLLQALSIGLLWQGLRDSSRRRWIWLALGGIATGLTAYTYLAARLFPIPLALTLIALIIFDRHRWDRIKDLAVYGLSALISFAPLGWFFLNHPDLFSERINQVAPTSPAEAWSGWEQALKMFFIGGDPLWRFNLPGKSLFDPVLGGLFVIGLGIAIWEMIFTGEKSTPQSSLYEDSPPLQGGQTPHQRWRGEYSLNRARGVLLLVWPLIMLAPTALAVGSITPSNLRAVGLAPLIALYPALGIVTLIDWLHRIKPLPRRVIDAAYPSALILIMLVGGWSMLSDTLEWGRTLVLYYDNDGHVAAVADFLNTGDIPPSTPYIATYHLQHPTLAFLTKNYADTLSLFGGDALVLASSGDSLDIYTRDAEPPEEWRSFLEPYLIAAPPGPDTSPDFWAYLLPTDFDPGWSATEAYNFSNQISLEQAQFYPAESGLEAQIDLAWRITAPGSQPDFAFVAEVCDQWDWCWIKANLDGTLERGHNNTYNSTQWSPGERLLTRIHVPLPQGIPPGDYVVRVSIFSAAGNATVPTIDQSGNMTGKYAEVGPLPITVNTLPDVREVPIQHRLMEQSAPTVTLIGYDLPVLDIRSGESIDLALYWLNEGTQPEDLPVTLMLGEEMTLYQGDPVHGTHPLSDWQPNELITDRYRVQIPADLRSGSYPLTVRLGDNPPISLGMLNVAATVRQFDLPVAVGALDQPALLGDLITLVGTEGVQKTVEPGGTLIFRLVWQAEAEIDDSYTVFIHLVDDQGNIVAQMDRQPQIDDQPYPTDLWLPSEVVIDAYALSIPPDIPPGTYTLRVGMYLPDNGQRLTIPGTDDNAVSLPDMIEISSQ